jgi:hypothetical protein
MSDVHGLYGIRRNGLGRMENKDVKDEIWMGWNTERRDD